MRVLIVEDEPNLGRQLRSTLEGAGYAVDLATDGEDGHYLGSTESYDAIVLDLGLPEVDGLTVLDRWRREGRTAPVLVLTARDSWSDKVAGLDAGADDYVAKPFQTEELIARLRALIRRDSDPVLRADGAATVEGASVTRLTRPYFPGAGRGPVGKAPVTTRNASHVLSPTWTPAHAGKAAIRSHQAQAGSSRLYPRPRIVVMTSCPSFLRMRVTNTSIVLESRSKSWS